MAHTQAQKTGGQKNESAKKCRGAGWNIFKPKIAIWVNFGGYCNGRCWYICTAIWYILRQFGILYGTLVYLWVIFIFPVLVCCTEKNLATVIKNETTHTREEKKYERM
jgi:hypothetical protein